MGIRNDKALLDEGLANLCPIGWWRVESRGVDEDHVEVGDQFINHRPLCLGSRPSVPQRSQINSNVLAICISTE